MQAAQDYLEAIPRQGYPGFAGFKRYVQDQATLVGRGRCDGDFFGFTNVPRTSLEVILDRRSSIGAAFRLDYFEDAQALIVRIRSSLHEDATHVLTGHVIFLFGDMGLSSVDIRPIGSTRHLGCSREKEADMGWKPFELRGWDSAWPTVVVQSGVSESLPQLRLDARWWISQSHGEVMIVLLIHLQRRSRSISLEVWKPGLPSTNACLAQTISITSPAHGPNNPPPVPDDYTVIGSHLVFPFKEVMLRDPVGREGDLVIDHAFLKKWAWSVWKMVS